MDFKSMKRREQIEKISIHVILILVSITMLVPFLWMILTAFKTVTESTSVNPFVIFPSKWQFENFNVVINNMNFMQLYWNTFLLILGRVVAAVLTATIAGYAFARLEFPLKKFFFSLILFQMMVPAQIFIIPQYLMVSKLGMLDTIFALVFPGLVTAFGTFLLNQSFMALPKDLEEAARIDGCNIGRTFLFVMMPLSAALAKMQGQYTNNYPQLMTASLLACIPMIILYLIFQKQFIEGISTSGGKL